MNSTGGLIKVFDLTVVPHIRCRDGPEHDDARDFADFRTCFSMNIVKHELNGCVVQRSSAV